MLSVLAALLAPSLIRWFLRPLELVRYECDPLMGLVSLPKVSPDHVLLCCLILHAVAWYFLARWYLQILRLLRRKDCQIEFKWLRTRIIALTLIYLLGLPYFSPDVFFYLGKGWLDFAYGLSPFSHSIQEVPDFRSVEMFGNIFPEFYKIPGNYGGLFHWFTRQIASFCGGSQILALIFFKVLTLLFHLGSLFAVAGIARHLRLNVPAAMWAFGANPVILFTSLWTTHNDALMLPCILFSVWMALKKLPFSSGFFLAAGFCIKLVPILLAPFLCVWFLRRTEHPLRQLLQFAGGFLATVAILNLLNDGSGSSYAWLTADNPYKAMRSSLLVPLTPALVLLGPGSWTIAYTLLKGLFCLGSAWAVWRMWSSLKGPSDYTHPVRLIRSLAWVFCFYLVIASPIITEWYLLWFLPLWAIVLREREVQGLKILTLYYLPTVIFCFKVIPIPASVSIMVLGQLFLFLLFLAALLRCSFSFAVFRRKPW